MTKSMLSSIVLIVLMMRLGTSTMTVHISEAPGISIVVIHRVNVLATSKFHNAVSQAKIYARLF